MMFNAAHSEVRIKRIQDDDVKARHQFMSEGDKAGP